LFWLVEVFFWKKGDAIEGCGYFQLGYFFLGVDIEHSKTMEILASLVMKFSDPTSLGALWFSLKLLCVLLKQICREKH